VQAGPTRSENAFLALAFLVLQGAFSGLTASGDATGTVGDGNDFRRMLAFLIVILGTAFYARKRLPILFSGLKSNIGYFVLPLIILASAIWSIEPSLTLKRSILVIAICGFDLYVATIFGLDKILKLLSTTIFFSALASLLVALALPSLGREFTEGLGGDWKGIFPQKNTLGQVMAVGVFAEMSLMIMARRPLGWGAIRVLFLLAVLSRSHSASSALSAMSAVGIALFFMSVRKGAGGVVVGGLIACATLILVIALLASDPLSVFEMLDRDPSLTGRTELWTYVWEAIRERPALGWGYSAFWTPDSRNVTYIQHAIRWAAPNSHNGYLEIALGTGLLGIVGLIATAFWAARRIVKLAAQRNDVWIILLLVGSQLILSNLTESFMIDASVCIWNVFTIIGFRAGIEQAKPALTSPPARFGPIGPWKSNGKMTERPSYFTV
jgi:O-antigen ligase